MSKRKNAVIGSLLVSVFAAGWTGCGGSESADKGPAGIDPKVMADALFSVMEADRTSYTKFVVQRSKVAGFVHASETWKDEDDKGSLPLPAQMFRMASERVSEKTDLFSYQLKSPWPVNKQNAPKTDVEKEGFDFIVANGGAEPFYKEETIAGKKYFTAIYADVAVSDACISCHNSHKDSPRSDFKLGDTMGGVVVRIPLAQ